MNFIPRVNVIGDGLDPKWSSALRSTALTVILLRAGWFSVYSHGYFFIQANDAFLRQLYLYQNI